MLFGLRQGSRRRSLPATPHRDRRRRTILLAVVEDVATGSALPGYVSAACESLDGCAGGEPRSRSTSVGRARSGVVSIQQQERYRRIVPLRKSEDEYVLSRWASNHFLLTALLSGGATSGWVQVIVSDRRASLGVGLATILIVILLWMPGGPARRMTERLPPPKDSEPTPGTT